MTQTNCPTCRTPFEVNRELVGQKGLCPTCHSKFIITAPLSTTHEVLDGRSTQPMYSESTQIPKPETAKPPILLLCLATLIAGGFGWGYWELTRLFPAGAELAPWPSFIGDLHPLVVHFPVALVIAVAALGFFGGKSRKNDSAVNVLLWINLLACGAAILFGHFLGVDGGRKGDTFDRHIWTGLGLGVFSYLALFFKLILDTKKTMAITTAYNISLFGALAGVALAGHFGASLTHGDVLDKLPWKAEKTTAHKIDAGAAAQPTKGNLEDQTVLAGIIQPILNAKCVGCHGDERQKGELRMDTHSALLLAGESGKPCIVPGDSAKSEAMVRILLPMEDDEHMPPEKKPQLTADETAIFKWWIDSGASATVLVRDANPPAPIKEKFTTVLQSLSSTGTASGGSAAPGAPAAAPDDKLLALEKEIGSPILTVAQNDPSLTFNCVNMADKFDDAMLAKFVPLAERFSELNLSRSKITDAGAPHLAAMKNLVRLRLDNTAITDAALDQIVALPKLEYLNLFNTKVTDAGLAKLEKLAALKNLYVWQTGVTKPAAEALHGKLPNLTINLGWDNVVGAPPPPKPAETTPTAPAENVPLKQPMGDDIVYATLIQPLLNNKCVGCHGTEKKKGKLQMHDFASLMKGGDTGVTIVAGKSAESLTMKRIALPADDDEHMPPKEKPQLSEKEIAILKWWIDAGASADVKAKDANIPAELFK